MDKQAQFESLLQVPATLPEERRRAAVQGRLIGMGFGKICGRCGGTGHYSFNLRDGTVCYGCSGRRYVAQSLTPTLYRAVEAAVAAGKLDSYLTAARERARLLKLANSASMRVLNAWTAAINKAYDWNQAANGDARARYIADTFNAPMYQLNLKIDGLRDAFLSLVNRVPKSAEAAAAKVDQVSAAAQDLVQAADSAIAEIKALGEQLGAYLAQDSAA